MNSLRRYVLCPRTIARIAAPLVCALAACDDDGFSDFVSGGCKGAAIPATASSPSGLFALYPGLDPSSLAPYFCLVFEKGSGVLHLDIVNYFGDCASPMGGEVRVDGRSAVTLRIRQSDCSVSTSCSCLYDMALDVRGVALDSDLDVTVERVECHSSSSNCMNRARLPLTVSDTGVACQFSYDDVYGVAGTGHLGSPCKEVAPDGGVAPGPCEEGLACALGADSMGVSRRCLASCTDAGDCPAADFFTCEAGLCQVAHPLERVCD